MNRIPKIIHYRGLLDDLFSELVQKCVSFWKEKITERTKEIYKKDYLFFTAWNEWRKVVI